MKTLVIHDTEDDMGQEIVSRLKEKGGNDLSFIDLADRMITPCVGCFGCWVKTPGLCRFRDDADGILKAELNSDRVLFLCPVTWGGYSPRLKVLQDRSICLALPFFRIHRGETHHPPRYKKYPQLFMAGYGTGLTEEEINLFSRTVQNLSDNLFEGGRIRLFFRALMIWNSWNFY